MDLENREMKETAAAIVETEEVAARDRAQYDADMEVALLAERACREDAMEQARQ